MKYVLIACLFLVSASKGTITCKIDGAVKSYDVAQSFFEISLATDPQGPKDGLEIVQSDGKKEGFLFELKKSGQTKIKSMGQGDLNCIINYVNSGGVTYTANDAVINVISYGGGRLSGTFSGKFVNVIYEGKNKAFPKYITVTDGKFDLTR